MQSVISGFSIETNITPSFLRMMASLHGRLLVALNSADIVEPFKNIPKIDLFDSLSKLMAVVDTTLEANRTILDVYASVEKDLHALPTEDLRWGFGHGSFGPSSLLFARAALDESNVSAVLFHFSMSNYFPLAYDVGAALVESAVTSSVKEEEFLVYWEEIIGHFSLDEHELKSLIVFQRVYVLVTLLSLKGSYVSDYRQQFLLAALRELRDIPTLCWWKAWKSHIWRTKGSVETRGVIAHDELRSLHQGAGSEIRLARTVASRPAVASHAHFSAAASASASASAASSSSSSTSMGSPPTKHKLTQIRLARIDKQLQHASHPLPAPDHHVFQPGKSGNGSGDTQIVMGFRLPGNSLNAAPFQAEDVGAHSVRPLRQLPGTSPLKVARDAGMLRRNLSAYGGRGTDNESNVSLSGTPYQTSPPDVRSTSPILNLGDDSLPPSATPSVVRSTRKASVAYSRAGSAASKYSRSFSLTAEQEAASTRLPSTSLINPIEDGYSDSPNGSPIKLSPLKKSAVAVNHPLFRPTAPGDRATYSLQASATGGELEVSGIVSMHPLSCTEMSEPALSLGLGTDSKVKMESLRSFRPAKSKM